MRVKMNSKYENTHLSARAPWRAMIIEIDKALGYMKTRHGYHAPESKLLPIHVYKKGINVLV